MRLAYCFVALALIGCGSSGSQSGSAGTQGGSGPTTSAGGTPLKVDPVAESIPGNDRASAMLTREYRKPFVVPAQAEV